MLHYGAHMAGWMWLWWLAGIGFLVLFVWIVTRAGSGPSGTTDSPETILKRRYAQGEITRDEYERRLNDVRK